MNTKLVKLFKTHSTLLEACNRSTERILKYATEKDSEQATAETENRERLIQVITEYYTRIDNILEQVQLDSGTLSRSKEWLAEFNTWINNTAESDQKILLAFQAIKEDTKKDISTAFKLRQKFSGYNLNNIRK